MNPVEKQRRCESAREWLAFAKGDLALARLAAERKEALAHQLCFLAQQAAEKSIKAVFISRGVVFPFIHDLGALIKLAIKEGISLPDTVAAAEELTPYAVEARYPGMNGEINSDEVDRALDLAGAAFTWAEKSVGMAEKQRGWIPGRVTRITKLLNSNSTFCAPRRRHSGCGSRSA